MDENRSQEQPVPAQQPQEAQRNWGTIIEAAGAGLAGGMGPDVYHDIKAGVKAAADKLRKPPDAGDAGKGGSQDPPPADPPSS